MSDDNQVLVPRSFIELFIAPGRLKPSEPREVIMQRHELCEDMAQILTETARTKLFELGVAETDVLDRMARGLRAEGTVLSDAEAGWGVCRLAELLGWPMPA
jgi:hypothetical protein